MQKTIQINGEHYIKVSEISQDYKPSPVKIVVLNKGWIVIGKVREEGTKTIIQNASVIRKWGTTQGLGELAKKGKLPDTILDDCPDVTVETCNTVFLMNCNQQKWVQMSTFLKEDNHSLVVMGDGNGYGDGNGDGYGDGNGDGDGNGNGDGYGDGD